MAQVYHFAPDAALDDITMALDRDGAVILDNLITANEATAIVDELRPYVEATAFRDRRFRRTTNVAYGRTDRSLGARAGSSH